MQIIFLYINFKNPLSKKKKNFKNPSGQVVMKKKTPPQLLEQLNFFLIIKYWFFFSFFSLELISEEFGLLSLPKFLLSSLLQ